jgi:hypothetical protein
MNNKYKIGDKVNITKLGLQQGESLTEKLKVIECRGVHYRVEKLNGFQIVVEESCLQPYIEEDTQDDRIDETVIKHIEQEAYGHEFIISGEDYAEYQNLLREKEMNNEKCCAETVGLDYKWEYNKLLEEHEQTKELLEIAKVALKLTTELISTNE